MQTQIDVPDDVYLMVCLDADGNIVDTQKRDGNNGFQPSASQVENEYVRKIARALREKITSDMDGETTQEQIAEIKQEILKEDASSPKTDDENYIMERMLHSSINKIQNLAILHRHDGSPCCIVIGGQLYCWPPCV